MRLNYISWADNTGYAIAAKSYIAALREAGVAVSWVPMDPGPLGYVARRDDGASAKLGDQHADTVLIHTVPEYYPDWIAPERAGGRRVFGYTVWELDRLPRHWPGILNQLDGVIVPCEWNKDVFRNSGVTVPIHVVPHLSQMEDCSFSSHDQAALLERVSSETGLEISNRFIFYTIGFWSNRKAPHLALEAYWQAFDEDDPVLMVVKTSAKDITRFVRSLRHGFRRRHPSPVDAARRLARRHARPARWIMIPDESLTDSEMMALHHLGDCYVSLSRGEGWGLGAFEAAWLAKPVVMTGYGGQRDFLNPELAWLVDYKMVPVHEPTWSASYTADDLWAEPDVTQAAGYLRRIVEDPAAAKMRASRLAGEVRKRFSKEQVVRSLITALK